MKSFLENLQSQIEVKLNSEADFKNFPVITHQQSEIESCMKEFFHSGIAQCIVVMNPIPEKITPSAKSIAFEELNVRIHIIESFCARLNDVSSISIAEKVSKLLHCFKPRIDNWRGWLKLDEKRPWREIKDPSKSGKYILEINFKAKGSLAD